MEFSMIVVELSSTVASFESQEITVNNEGVL